MAIFARHQYQLALAELRRHLCVATVSQDAIGYAPIRVMAASAALIGYRGANAGPWFNAKDGHRRSSHRVQVSI